MNVQLGVLADCANVAPPGKLNIMGVFDTIRAGSFPVRHPFMVLALRLRLDYEDGSKNHKIEIVMVDEDGREYLRVKGNAKLGKIKPGGFSHANQIFQFVDIAFGRPGKYSFRIMWDGKERERVELQVLKGEMKP